jgi:DNA-directed RNA polymerase subunit E'/Rpb7
MSHSDRPKTAYKKKQTQQQKNLYNQLLITRTVPISINNIGNTIKETLEKSIASQIEGKCIVEGYIKPYSVEVITFSSGLVMGSNVIFEVVIQCDVCSPVEGMNIKCIAKHINKAGIRAEINETPSPVVIFIARDHNYSSPLFANVKENDEIKVRVIGQRFELNDKYISIIAEIVEGQSENVQEETIVPAASLVLASAPAPASASLASAPASLAPAPTKKKRATIRINIPKIKINN